MQKRLLGKGLTLALILTMTAALLSPQTAKAAETESAVAETAGTEAAAAELEETEAASEEIVTVKTETAATEIAETADAETAAANMDLETVSDAELQEETDEVIDVTAYSYSNPYEITDSVEDLTLHLKYKSSSRSFYATFTVVTDGSYVVTADVPESDLSVSLFRNGSTVSYDTQKPYSARLTAGQTYSMSVYHSSSTSSYQEDVQLHIYRDTFTIDPVKEKAALLKVSRDLTVTAVSESGTCSYQWYGADTSSGPYDMISGAVSSVYTVGDDIRAYYKCVVTEDSTGKTKEAFFKIYTIYTDWNGDYYSYNVKPGDPVIFDCADPGVQSVLGADHLSYQWKTNQESGAGYQEIEGATGSTYTIPETTVEMKGKQWICQVSDGVTSYSVYFQLNLQGGLTVATSGSNQIHYWGYPGETVVLHPLASTEAGTLTYTWRDGTVGEYYNYAIPADYYENNTSNYTYIYCTISNGIDSDYSLQVIIHVMNPAEAAYALPITDFTVADAWRDWYIVDQTPYSNMLTYWPSYKDENGTEIKVNDGKDPAKVYVNYENGTSDYAGIIRDANNSTNASVMQKLYMIPSVHYDDLNADLPETGDYIQYYQYKNIQKEQNVHIVKIGVNGTKAEEGQMISGERAGAESKDYAYYQFIPQTTRIYKIDFSAISGKGKARLYQRSRYVTDAYLDPIAEVDLDAADSLMSYKMTAGMDYYIVVSGESSVQYDMKITPYILNVEIGIDTNLNGADEFTAKPSENGYYQVNYSSSRIIVADENGKVINQFGTYNEQIYLVSGKTYYFTCNNHNYSSIMLSKVEDVSYDADIITGGRMSQGQCYWLIDGDGDAVFYPGVSSQIVHGTQNNDPIPDAAQEQIVTLTFEEGITQIGQAQMEEYPYYNFMDAMPNIVSVSLPSTVTMIGTGFLKNCPKLEQAAIPAENSARWVGTYSLSGTPFVDNQPGEYKMLENIVLDYTGENVSTGIPENSKVLAFHSMVDSDTETQVSIRDQAKYLGAFSIAKSDTLTSIDIPGNVTEIQYCAFYQDTALKNVIIADGTETIREEAFFACTGLEKIEIPKSVKWIESHAIGYAYAEGYGSNLTYYKNENLPVIRCYMASRAHTYALENDLPYELIDGPATLSVSISTQYFAYNGQEQKPELTVKYQSYNLKEGTDYTVTWPEDMINPGKKTITVTGIGNYGGTYSRTYQITEKEVNVRKITLRETAVEIKTTAGRTLQYTITPGNATNKNVTWTSSNEKVATVDSSGRVKALTYGKAVITVTTEDGGLTASCTVQTRFYDVADSSKYYYKPIYWAADGGITNGFEGGKFFGPAQNCTREQMITFLYRQAGKPAVSAADIKKYNTFKDVKSGSYYEKAVVWAAKKGITNGYSSGPNAGKFGVGLDVTREDTVTFLYRAAGKPAVSAADIKSYSFPDVVSGKYYAKPIVWAAKNGITKGYSSGEYAGKFGVGLNVIRADLITFLYRYNNLK